MPGNRFARLAILALALATLAFAGGPGFRNEHLLDDHFAMYGPGFGHITKQQYLHLAQQLRDTRPGKNILESHRADGGIAKFDLRRGYFGSYNADGTIRTFLVPPDGVRHFEQLDGSSTRK